MKKILKVMIMFVILGLVVLTGCSDNLADPPKVKVTPGTSIVLGGDTFEFEAIIQGLPNNINNTIVWSIVEKGIHGGTYIDEKGLLTVAVTEKQPKLTIRAALYVDPSIFGQSVVAITLPDPVITGLTLNAASSVGLTGKTVIFSTVVKGTNNPPLFMDWEIVTQGHHEQTTIVGGLLAIAGEETLPSITVKATSVYDSNFADTATITIATLPERMKTVSPGANHTAAIGNDGSLWAWGNNMFGQVGDGTENTRRFGITPIGTQTDWEFLSAGDEYTLAVKKDGSLWAWGNNANGRTGLGTDTGTTIVPTRVGTDADWVLISAGRSHALAIKENGTLWAWGNNANGRTGLGITTGSASTPAQVGIKTDWVFISAGVEHSFGIRDDGVERTLWAWGNGANGRLGTGNTVSQDNPVQAGTLTDWVSVSASNTHSMGIRTNGYIMATGSTNNGQLGGGWGAGQQTNNFIRAGTDDTWVSVSTGLTYTMATRTDGSLWAAGSTNNGQLGGGWIGGQTAASFNQIGSDLVPWTSVFTGNNHTVAFRGDGSLWVWGANVDGQLGDGLTNDRLSPFQIVP
ncbi:MAG: hypothetical protein LBC80_05570 [Treponema sp.]|jgi:alpha-tubulin suppressor-like RCC1 family protein|nr:hypothetical protein [Treponema sp.]